MNFATAYFYLTAVLTTSSAIVGEARSKAGKAKSGKAKSGKAEPGKAEQCKEALNGFNLSGGINFGSHSIGYIRTNCAGNTFLLTNPKKAEIIYERVCPNVDSGFEALDGYVRMAEEAGGCTGSPQSGQPSRAMAEYVKCRDDAYVATEMVCKDADSSKLCWSVMYQLTKDRCWTSDFTEPALDNKSCLPLGEEFESVDGKDVQVNVSCKCLKAYADAYPQFTMDGRDSFGANDKTLKLVKNRLEDCPAMGLWG